MLFLATTEIEVFQRINSKSIDIVIIISIKKHPINIIYWYIDLFGSKNSCTVLD